MEEEIILQLAEVSGTVFHTYEKLNTLLSTRDNALMMMPDRRMGVDYQEGFLIFVVVPISHDALLHQ